MPLASLMANGDAWDAITLRIVAAAASVTATRPRGGRSQEGEILVRTLMSYTAVSKTVKTVSRIAVTWDEE